jgi:hypothetical protein
LVRLALAGKDGEGYSYEDGMRALASLAQPEADSRSGEHEGRRMIRIDGGYLILNFMRYRDYDHNGAARARQYRNRKKETRHAERHDRSP